MVNAIFTYVDSLDIYSKCRYMEILLSLSEETTSSKRSFLRLRKFYEAPEYLKTLTLHSYIYNYIYIYQCEETSVFFVIHVLQEAISKFALELVHRWKQPWWIKAMSSKGT